MSHPMMGPGSSAQLKNNNTYPSSAFWECLALQWRPRFAHFPGIERIPRAMAALGGDNECEAQGRRKCRPYSSRRNLPVAPRALRYKIRRQYCLLSLCVHRVIVVCRCPPHRSALQRQRKPDTHPPPATTLFFPLHPAGRRSPYLYYSLV